MEIHESDLIKEIFAATQACSGRYELIKDNEDTVVLLYSKNAVLSMEYRLKGFIFDQVRAGLEDLGKSSQPSLPTESEALQKEMCW